jgi:aminoglycoside phosphotransferase family enzyme/predicted kinase
MEAHPQEDLFRAMATPDFYPHAVQAIEKRETHISAVFLTGDWVYKVKKAVDYGFIDFSTAAKRHRFCKRECELNQRLAVDVYNGVVKITRHEGGFRLGGSGPTVDYAVRMRQLPETRSLAWQLRTGAMSGDFLWALISHLTAFYTRQEPCPQQQSAAAYHHLRSACENNFHQTLPFVGKCLDRHLFEIVRQATNAFLARRQLLFAQRADEGWIRDGHGDLRACHIYTLPGKGIRVIDCIEFDDRLRQIDIVSDLAFLAMDFDFADRPHLSSQMMDIYSQLSRDPGVYLVLPFYKCYRAMVRCKVSCLHLETAGSPRARPEVLEEARRFLKLAYRYAVSFSRPKIWAFSGLPASGKSTVARAMASVIAAPHLRSDVIRHTLFKTRAGAPSSPAFSTGIYAQIPKRRTYGRLLEQTRNILSQGKSVIVDATFNRPEYRREISRLARDHHLRLTFVECRAPLRVIKSRLSQRAKHFSLSQARVQDFEAFRQEYTPMGGAGLTAKIVVDTTRSPEECVRQILAEDHRLCTACMVSSLQNSDRSMKGGPHVPRHPRRNRSHHRP